MDRRIILFLTCLLILPITASARMNMLVSCAGGQGAAGCDPATQYVGDKTDYSDEVAADVSDIFYCYIRSPTCTGTLSYAYYEGRSGASPSNAKVLAYSCPSGDTCDGSVGPSANAALMATATIILPESSAITKSSAEASGSDTSVATTEKIWICAVASGATARMVRRNTGGSNNQYSLTIAGGYASPPATLPGGFTQTAGRDQGVYFEIK